MPVITEGPKRFPGPNSVDELGVEADPSLLDTEYTDTFRILFDQNPTTESGFARYSVAVSLRFWLFGLTLRCTTTKVASLRIGTRFPALCTAFELRRLRGLSLRFSANWRRIRQAECRIRGVNCFVRITTYDLGEKEKPFNRYCMLKGYC